MTTNKSWVTLATNDSYALGALVLAHSLKNVGTKHQLTILITPGVTASMKEQIHKVFNDVKVVDVLDSKDEAHLALMSRPELGITFTKLHCWTLTNYEKCVFLDADTLVLQNCDELFDREELSAAPDPGWPDCFNSGVFVFKPSLDTFKQLLDFAKSKGSFDGGDQGLLNLFFKDWAHKDISKHLSFTYNVVWSSTYSYLPALKQFGQNMKIVHFIASSKPWLQKFDVGSRIVTSTTGGSGLQALLQFWWDLFCKHVHPVLSTQMGGLAAQFANLPIGEKSADQQALEDFLRRQSWEHGNADYLGKDSFSNIWAKINESLETPSESKVEPNIALTTPSTLEIVHTQEVKPLKSALKKTSTSSQPDSSQLVGSIETTTKQLEKLDIKNCDINKAEVPSTPTVTSPTPPTTPATQLQESPKTIEPSKDVPIPVEQTKEILKSVEPESVESKPVENPIEPSKDIPTPVETPKEILKTVEPECVEPKPVEESKETVQQTKEPVKTEEQQDPNEPPVPPKRTHKSSGTDGSKNVEPSQEK